MPIKIGAGGVQQDVPVAFSEITNKPTTLSGYGITNGLDTTSTQSIGGAKTFSGLANFSIGLRIGATHTRTTSTTGMAAGEWREAAPAGMVQPGLWIVRFYWESPGQIPYVLSGGTIWCPIITNDGTGRSKSFSCLMASHIGGDYDISLRSKCGTGQVGSGLEFSLNFVPQPSNITFSFFCLSV